ncbi:hypothetical protein [Caulobacter sp. 1776]|uniref:head-tail joining protein n=1 Tax=Caulobacter sp. 1776 TaxID=3156420 RepID=UPI003396C131
MSVWTETLDAIYDDPEHSTELQFLDAGGAIVAAVRALPDLADKADLYGQRRSVVERNVYRVRVHELAARAPGFQPSKQGKVRVDGQVLVMVNAPQHPDTRRLEWRVDCSA